MTWPEVEFESLFAIPSRNGIYKTKDHHGAGVPIVNMGELFAFNRIGDQPMSLVQMSDAEMDKSGLVDGDLLFGRRSLVEEGAGKCSMVYVPTGPLTFESSIIRVRLNKAIADPEFFFNYFRSPVGRSRIRAIVGGAAVKGIRGSDLKLINVHLPPINEQIAIRQIVSTYDDLIATNQRRIALLEDAARRLYREWFVHLRFPGHESVPVKDGMPKGWQPASFAELVEINPRTPFARDVERPFVEMSALSETSMIIGPRSKRVIGGGAKFRNGDTLFARITPCTENGKTGFVQFLEHDDAVASGSTEFIVFRSAKVNPWWIYCTAREDNFREHAIRSMAGSDGRQRVNPRCFDQFAMLQPPQSVLAQFEHVVKDAFAQIETLCNHNEQLARARDLLLPKLMSGQLDVSGIRLPEEASL